MKQLLRQGIESMPAPLPVLIHQTFSYLRYPQVRQRRERQRRILERLARPTRVLQGPFQGMRYIALAYCSEILPKVFGTYENELAPAIEAIYRSHCDRIVDVGAAEGYYAVGMALRNPEAQIVAFEINPSARHYLRRLTRCNDVSKQITIRCECTVDSLGEALSGAKRPAVICDCEGAESRLLDPDRIDSLRRALILVETHDGLQTRDGVLEGITTGLQKRFAHTHDSEVIASRARQRQDLPGEYAGLDDTDADEAMNEGRPWAQWLFLRPKPAESRWNR
jgi:hypothetical protein